MVEQKSLTLVSQPPSGTFKPLKYDKTFGIAVSGDVRVTKTERKIIDTSAFQRLRNVRQLGPSLQVYPTALHTRFDHSLGTLQMVEEMVRAIREARIQGTNEKEDLIDITDEQHRLARLYGLLHDITHVPFGHTLEDELHIFPSHDSPAALARFEHFLGRKSEIGRRIIKDEGESFYNRFVTLIQKGKTERLLPHRDEFIYHLVSDTVCADLLDYARRDSLFCNLGLELPYRFLKYLYVQDINLDVGLRSRVLIRLWKPRSQEARRDTLTDLARLLDARYMIAERVYFHHTKIIAGTMIGRAVQEAVRIGALTERDMWSLGDDTLIHYLTQLAPESERRKKAATKPDVKGDGAALAAELARAYAERCLYKCIKNYRAPDFQPSAHDGTQDYVCTLLADADERRHMENEIAHFIGVPEGHILFYPADKDMNLKIARAVVRWEGNHRILEEVTDPVLSMRLKAIKDAHRMLWGIMLIGHPDLKPEQRRLAERAFEARFLHRGESQDNKRRAKECYKEIVRARALSDDRLSSLPTQQFENVVHAVAEELVEPTYFNKLESRDALDPLRSLLLRHAKPE